jgi:hypothetical protein
MLDDGCRALREFGDFDGGGFHVMEIERDIEGDFTLTFAIDYFLQINYSLL